MMRSCSPSCTMPTIIMTTVSVRKRRLRMTMAQVEVKLLSRLPTPRALAAARTAAASACADARDSAVVDSRMPKAAAAHAMGAQAGWGAMRGVT